MALGAEPVEGAAHVELFLSSHIEERQVDGGAPGVATLLIDILLLEEHALVEVGTLTEGRFFCYRNDVITKEPTPLLAQ